MERTVFRGRPSIGEFTVPGDKSIAHRAVLLAALADGTSQIRGFPHSADVQSTLSCVSRLGIETRLHGDSLNVVGKGLRGLREAGEMLDAGNSGTTIRLLSGIVAGQPFETSISGDTSLRKRPMKRIIEPLERMGAQIEATAQETPPLRIRGRAPLRSITFELPVASAQVKSAVVLAGLLADGTTTVIEKHPTRDHTERMLALPVRSVDGDRRITVEGGKTIPSFHGTIPGDLSSSVYLVLAALLVSGSKITLKRISLNPTRTPVLHLLKNLGARIDIHERGNDFGEPYGDLEVVSSELKGRLSLTQSDVPLVIDEIPALAVACAAHGIPFDVRGAAELRHKESDRIHLLVKNLRALGIETEEYDDGFAFGEKNIVFGTRIETQGDHRIAMAFAVAGLISEKDMTIPDAEATEISFPGFFDLLGKFGTVT